MQLRFWFIRGPLGETAQVTLVCKEQMLSRRTVAFVPDLDRSSFRAERVHLSSDLEPGGSHTQTVIAIAYALRACLVARSR